MCYHNGYSSCRVLIGPGGFSKPLHLLKDKPHHPTFPTLQPLVTTKRSFPLSTLDLYRSYWEIWIDLAAAENRHTMKLGVLSGQIC